VSVEGGIHTFTAGKRENRAQPIAAMIGVSMHGRGIFRGANSRPVFHNVDFTAVGPAGCVNVAAQRPECRPESLMGWKLDVGFDTSELESFYTLGFKAR